ncbi:hypothetical protein HaLaN_12947, partial [Haematococcus lacustris]
MPSAAAVKNAVASALQLSYLADFARRNGDWDDGQAFRDLLLPIDASTQLNQPGLKGRLLLPVLRMFSAQGARPEAVCVRVGNSARLTIPLTCFATSRVVSD